MRVLIAALLAFLAGATPAAAQPLQPGDGFTAPGYPGTTLTLTRSAPFVAGIGGTAHLSGHAEWSDPAIPDDLSLFVQDAAAARTCESGYGTQLRLAIARPDLNATTAASGFVMSGEHELRPGPPATGIDWSADSPPFAARPGVREVLLCGYQRHVRDDVAAFALAVRVVPPSCTVGTRVVRRGRGLAITCNLSGALAVRFTRGGRARTIVATLRAGRGTVATGALRRGRFRVRFAAGAVRIPGSTTVQVRRRR